MIVLLISTAVVLFIIHKWVSMRPPNFPPGPPHFPFIGSIPFVPRKNIHFIMDKWRLKYGPVVGLFLGPLKAIAVCDPNTVLTVLKLEEFTGRPLLEIQKQRAFGKRLGIVFNDGPKWIEQRRFALRHLKDLGFGRTSMEGLILEEIDDLINEIKGKTVQVTGLFSLSTVNMLWHIMAGTRYKRHDPELTDLLNGLQAFFRGASPVGTVLTSILPFMKHIAPNLFNGKFHETNRKLQCFMLKIIKEHQSTLNENEPRDFIDVYLIEMKKYHGGDDTSFTGISFVFKNYVRLTGGVYFSFYMENTRFSCYYLDHLLRYTCIITSFKEMFMNDAHLFILLNLYITFLYLLKFIKILFYT